jgi:hypothetical protein
MTPSQAVAAFAAAAERTIPIASLHIERLPSGLWMLSLEIGQGRTAHVERHPNGRVGVSVIAKDDLTSMFSGHDQVHPNDAAAMKHWTQILDTQVDHASLPQPYKP